MPVNEAQVWSTAQAQGSGLGYWIEAICEAFLKMNADSAAGHRFAGRLEQHTLGPLALNFIRADPQEVWRTPRDIGRSTDNHFYLLHIRAGRLVVRQRGREAVVEAGACVLVDSKEPYHFSFPEGDFCLSTQLPAPWLNTWLPAPEDLVARPWGPATGGWGAVLAGALGNFSAQGFDDMPLPASAMADQIGSLLALAGGNPRARTSSHRTALLRRLRSAINDQFADAALAPTQVAQAHGISVRYLHALFAEAGTSFGAELMASRLERASRMLNDGRFGGLAVSEIAWRCGFKDPSHFARVFRRRFGSAPVNYQKGLR